MICKLLCFIGLHRWDLVCRSILDDSRYWHRHGRLPDDVVFCERCGKLRTVNP